MSETSVYETGVGVPMRDGVHLNASTFRPTAGRVPTLLVRTPYGIDTPRTGLPGNGAGVPHPTVFVDAGFAVVWVEARGTFGSDGEFRPVVDEADDGYDTVEWIISQPWSNGGVGTYGASYLGIAQWNLAATGHPALKAIAPMLTSMDPYNGVWRHPGGALALSAVTSWNALMALNRTIRGMQRGGPAEALPGIIGALRDPGSVNLVTPVAANPILSGEPSFSDAVAHADFDDFWTAQDRRPQVPRMHAPALSIAGWYDVFIVRQLRDFELLQAEAATVEAREHSRLIVGPWDHDPDLTGRFSDHEFGPMANAAAIDLMGEQVRHFARWLQDEQPVVPPAPVKLFVMGVDEWREFSAWPPAGSSLTRLHLDAGGGNHSGKLTSTVPPTTGVGTIVYDPRDPVPTTGGAQIPATWRFSGPTDQRVLDARADILRFASAPLAADVEAIGYISATLFVRTDALDSDLTVKLIDLHPDGTARVLCDGVVRLRYRHGTQHAEIATPGEVYEVTVDLAATANRFRRGHCIRVDVSSSNFPRFDRNTNTGGDIGSERIEDAVIAHNQVLTGRVTPSHVTLPFTTEPRFEP